jgi:uncharacterized protein
VRVRRSVLACAAAGLILAPLAWVATRSYQGEETNFTRAAPSPLLDSLRALDAVGTQAVRVPMQSGGSLAAWYVPPRNGATVLLLHGTSGDRSGLLWEARTLADAGFGVLAPDLLGYGLSDGAPDWSTRERRGVVDAIDWALQQPRVSPDRIGAFGFSYGAYLLAQVAAEDRRVRAVALSAPPTDLAALARWQYRRYGLLSETPAVWALRRSGVPSTDISAEQAIGRIAPRSLLLLGGSDDPTVPPSMVRRMFAAAGEPKQLWIVRTTQHGLYQNVAAAEYRHRLIDFFSRTLLRDCGARCDL